MIPDTIIGRLSATNEAVAEKRFKKMGFKVERLDLQGPRRRPEFLVSDSSGPILISEVKTIFSGGYLGDRHAHVSTQDPALLNTGVFRTEIDFSRIEDDLADAVRKCKTLALDVPSLADLPLLVVFFFDPFADHFSLYPSRMAGFPGVSGIAKVEIDHAIRAKAQKMSLEELKKVLDSGSMAGWPPNSKDFRIVPNECAKYPLPRHFVDFCLQRS